MSDKHKGANVDPPSTAAAATATEDRPVVKRGVGVLEALGGMITAPRVTLVRISREGAAWWPPVLALFLAVVVVDAKPLERLFFLVGTGGDVILRRIRDTLFDDLKTHAALLLGTIVVVAVAARLLGRGRIGVQNAAVAAAWLTVPLAAMIAVAGALEGFGAGAWWMPHLAVDALPALIVGREVSAVRFFAKCAIDYSIPLVLGVLLIASFVRRDAVVPAPPSPTRWKAGAALLAAAFVALAAGATVSSLKYAERIKPVLAGDVLPETKLHRLDEFGVSKEALKTASFKGRVLILDFWASWCAPCRRSMPELSALSERLKDQGLVVVGVNREPENPKAAAKAVGEIKPAFDCVLDDRAYGDKLGLTTLPTSYIVDKKGVVRHMHLGYTEISVIEAEVNALLTE